jgi:hypothetical protein
MLDTDPFRIAPGSVVDLHDRITRDDGGLGKKEGKKAVKKLSKRRSDLQELLYFLRAYREAIERCSTDAAPWYVVPAERRWFRDLVVMQTVVDKLNSLRMSYPEPGFDPANLEIP